MAKTSKVDKVEVKYYVTIPGKLIFIKDAGPNGATFTKYSTDRKEFDGDTARKVAEEYRCDILEVTIMTTTETSEKIIPQEVAK